MQVDKWEKAIVPSVVLSPQGVVVSTAVSVQVHYRGFKALRECAFDALR